MQKPSMCLFIALAVGCGGKESSGAPADAGTTGDSGAIDADLEAAIEAGCASPSGYAICGGPNNCFAGQIGMGTLCWDCTAEPLLDGGYDWGVCTNQKLPEVPFAVCGDNCVYIEALAVNIWNPFDYEVGDLFFRNGGGDRVRYSDFSLFTDTPLPQEGACPVLQGGAHACGPSCLPCDSGQICTGRSPIHPFGLCVTASATGGCGISVDGGQTTCMGGPGSCFVFTVQPETQVWADRNGWCLSPSACQSAAGSLPGGGTCH